MQSPAQGGSRIGIVFNGSPLFTGDAESGESEIRRWIIENDWLEAVIALPDQLFYNTGISTYIWIITNRKCTERKGKIQLIDARNFFVKMRKSLGNKRNQVGDGEDGRPDQITEITHIYGDFNHDETRDFDVEISKKKAKVAKTLVVSKIFDNEDFGYHKITVERPLKLNFQACEDRINRIEEESAFANLAKSNKKNEDVRLREIEAGKKRQQQIRDMLKLLAEKTEEKFFKNRDEFLQILKPIDRNETKVKLSAPELKAVLSALSERDETADICVNRKGEPEKDPELRDTETVPLKENIEEYFKREVLPHVPDAWIDHTKTKVGYEIPLNRHFYVYEPPRALEEIESDIAGLEKDIVSMLQDITGSNGK